MTEFKPELWESEIMKLVSNNSVFINSNIIETVIDEKIREQHKVCHGVNINKHKYFCFRVDDINMIQEIPGAIATESAAAARGLSSVIDIDIAKELTSKFSSAESPDIILLSVLGSKQKVKLVIGGIQLQATYNLDYLATSIVGDIYYGIGDDNAKS
jgi:hypothetical protein